MRILPATLVLLALSAGSASAANPRPRVLDAAFPATPAPMTAAELRFAGRDRNGVVRGYTVDFGDGSQTAISHCGPGRRARKGRRASFAIPYAYLAAGSFTLTVRVISGGCDGEPRQRSLPVTLSVSVG